MATVRIQVRRGTASQWTSANPTLAAGELGVESDTNLFKFGNGSTAWTSLAYANNSDVAIGEISQDAINTALTMGAGLTKTYNDGANTITITVDSTVVTLTGTQTLTNKTLTSPVINAPTGISKSDVGLGSVDNTGDTAKPISNATQSALDLKAPIASPTFTGNVNGITKTMVGLTNVDDTADTAKPVSTAQASAIATAKAEAISDATSQLNAVIAGAPAALNTLDELAAALGDDANYAATITTSLSGKLAKAGDTMTGPLTLNGAPTSDLHASTKGYTDSLGNTGLAYVDTHANKTTAVHGITDTAALATKTYADNVGSTAAADATTKANAAISAAAADATTKADAAKAAAEATAASTLSTHAADTTSIHGIADTSLLATTANVTAAIAQEVTDRNTAIETTLNTHNSDTTSVHGIADTSLLATTANVSSAITQEVTDRNTAISTSLATHTADTTSVHGIADTSALALTATVNSALDLKAPLASPTFTGTVTLPVGTVTAGMILDGTIVNADINAAAEIATSKISGLDTALGLKAPLASPTFTGTVSGITKTMVGLGSADDTADTAKPVSTAQASAIATAKAEAISDATSQVNALLTGAPAALNTLDELAAALGDDANYAATITTALGLKAPLASPTFTGTVTVAAAGVAFTDGTQTKAGVPSITNIPTAIAAGAHALAAGRADQFIPLTGAVVITLPATGYSTGQSIDFYQESGTGASFASTNSVVGTPGQNFRTTNSVVTAMKTASGWLVFGDLSA